MHVRWFGDTWRAPVCDPAYHITTPVDTVCIECAKKVTGSDRGIVCSCSPGIWGNWVLDTPDGAFYVGSYHLLCWMEQVVGGVMSAKILDRMNARQREAFEHDVDETAELTMPNEEAEPGRGWS